MKLKRIRVERFQILLEKQSEFLFLNIRIEFKVQVEFFI